jgi:hypothetical protein
MSKLSQISSVIFCKKAVKTFDLENKHLRKELEIKYHNIIKKGREEYICSGSWGGLSHNIKSDILIFFAKVKHRQHIEYGIKSNKQLNGEVGPQNVHRHTTRFKCANDNIAKHSGIEEWLDSERLKYEAELCIFLRNGKMLTGECNKLHFAALTRFC